MKVSINIDIIRLKSNFKNRQTLIFTKKTFFYKILGFTQSFSGVIGDIERFIQIIPGIYKNNRPITITGVDKVHLKCDCVNGTIVNGVREPIMYSCALSSPAGDKIYNQPRIKLLKKINKPVLARIRFYLEDDDHKPVDFNGETISFNCQLIKR